MQQISTLLILYPAALPGSLMSSTSFLIAFVGFSIYSIMSYTKSFTSFFPIWFPFISFCSLIAMARTSKPLLNKSGEGGHLMLLFISFPIYKFPSEIIRILFEKGSLMM